MSIITREIKAKTTSETDIIDITPQVMEVIMRSDINHGSVIVFVPGSTGALTTIEYESGVIDDLKDAISYFKKTVFEEAAI